jgi:hypothetical protein
LFSTLATVNGKRYISDEQTIREMEFLEAAEELVHSNALYEREFARKGDFLNTWKATERMWTAEEKLIALFTEGDRRLNWAYSEYRKRLLHRAQA